MSTEKTPGPLRLGGMALRNGLLIHGPTHWAAAARTPDGEIHVGSGPKPEIAPEVAGRLPFLRGPIKLAEAMAVLPVMRRRLPETRLPLEDWRVLAAMGGTFAASGILRNRFKSGLAREGALQLMGAVPAVVALRDRNLAAYHGVEHKAIASYEQGSDDVAAAPKEHDRCGSNLLAPMVALTAGGTALLEKLVESPGSLARAGIGLGSASVAVEMFAYSDRNPESSFGRAFHRPGREIQRLIATKEPTPEQLEVGAAALAEILRVESPDLAEAAGSSPAVT